MKLPVTKILYLKNSFYCEIIRILKIQIFFQILKFDKNHDMYRWGWKILENKRNKTQ